MALSCAFIVPWRPQVSGGIRWFTAQPRPQRGPSDLCCDVATAIGTRPRGAPSATRGRRGAVILDVVDDPVVAGTHPPFAGPADELGSRGRAGDRWQATRARPQSARQPRHHRPSPRPHHGPTPLHRQRSLRGPARSLPKPQHQALRRRRRTHPHHHPAPTRTTTPIHPTRLAGCRGSAARPRPIRVRQTAHRATARCFGRRRRQCHPVSGPVKGSGLKDARRLDYHDPTAGWAGTPRAPR